MRVAAASFFVFGLVQASIASLVDFSSVRIDVPVNAPAKVLEAADELRSDLKLVCGSSESASAPVRFVFGAPAGAEELKPFESRYRIDGKTIYLWGDVAKVDGMTRDGAFFAVSLFLERELGVRWLWEGRDGIAFEPRRQVELPDRREGSYVSSFDKCEIRNKSGFNAKSPGWLACNGVTPIGLRDMEMSYQRQSYADRKLWLRRMRLQDRKPLHYGHAFVDWKNWYFKDHPDYFNWSKEQKCRGWTGTAGPDRCKLCVSNERVVDQIIANWKAKKCPEYLCVCENDSYFFCECDACMALDANLPGEKPFAHMTDRYCNLWNRVARKAVKLRPDVKLIAYAYSVYRKPPRREKIEFPDNMLFGFVPSIVDADVKADLDAWIARGMKHFFLRPNFHHYGATIPRGYERVQYDIFHDCLSRGMVGVDYDAPAHRDLMNLEYYVTARQMNDPAASFDSIVEEFYSGFGPAAADARAYFEAVRRDGEAAREAFIQYRSKQVKVLDDSEFGHRLAFGFDEQKLRKNAALIAAACERWRGRVSPLVMRRLDALRLQAEQGVLAFRHYSESDSPKSPEFAQRGRELIDFRLAHKDEIRESWPNRFGDWGGEVRIWKRDVRYCIEDCDGGFLDPRGVKYGWSLNFESMSYGRWRKSDGISEITDESASKGKWSCRLDAAKKSSIRDDNLMVVPGGRYRMTVDLRAKGAIAGAAIKVKAYNVPEKKIPGRFVVDRQVSAAELPNGEWRTFSVEFTAPRDFPKDRAKWGADYVECMLPWIFTNGGEPGSSLFVDNVRFEFLGMPKENGK